jgi:hypothetical protein
MPLVSRRLLPIVSLLALGAAAMGLAAAPRALAALAASGATTSGAAYTPLVPTRLLDTRTTGQTLGSGSSLNLTVTGSDGVPSDVTAVALNLTVTDTKSSSYLSVYPTAGTRPSVSSLNWVAGETVANSAIVPVGSGGQISLYNHTGRTDVVVDLDGYFAPEQPGSGAGAYVPLAPSRIADTRSGSGYADAGSTIGPGGSLTVQVTGSGGVPAGAAAAILNVTATDTTTSSYLTVYPEGVTQPTTSNLNWVPGEKVANRVLAPLSSSGQVSVFNDAGRADVVVDVDGYFTSGTSSLPASAGLYTAITPTRVLDTRHASGYPGAGSTLFPGAVLPVSYSLLPSSVTAVVENLTAANTTAASFFTVYPGGGTRPTASDVNWSAGQVVANLTIATLSGHEETDIYNHAGYTDAILDAFGYFNLYTPAAMPTVTGIDPNTGSAAGGTVVTITGTGFSTTAGTTDFDFGAGNAATAVSCNSSISCTATSPPGSGIVDVTATVDGVTSATTSADQYTYTSPPPPTPGASQLVFTAQPGGAIAGSPFTTQPVVTIEDAEDNTVTIDTSTVTLSLASGPGTLDSGCTATTTAGVASFSGCEIDTAGMGYTLTATDGDLSMISTSFTVNAGSPAQLVFTTQPGGATAGAPFTAQPVVTIEDTKGNTVTSDPNTVTLALASGPDTLDSGCTATTTAGVAAFSGCEIDTAGTGYTLTATDTADGDLSVTSNSFTVSSGSPYQLVFTMQPPEFIASGISSFPIAVAVEDASGNVVTSDNSSTVALSLIGPSGDSLNCSGGNSMPTMSGVATFTGCVITENTGDTVQVSADSIDPTLPTALSSTVMVGS